RGHQVDLGPRVRARRQVQRRGRSAEPEDALVARLSHLLEAELAREANGFVEAYPPGCSPRLLEERRVDRHAAPGVRGPFHRVDTCTRSTVITRARRWSRCPGRTRCTSWRGRSDPGGAGARAGASR